MIKDRKVRVRDANALDFETDTSFWEIKSGLTAIRAVRDTLVRLVKGLVHRQDKSAYLVLVDPKVTQSSLEEELGDFKAAMRPEIAKRLTLVIVRNGDIEHVPADISPSDLAILNRELDLTTASQVPLPRPDKRSEVLRVVLHQWLIGQGPMTSDWVAQTVGCTYRTVASTIEKLGPVIERREDRRFQLRYFPREAWARFIAVSPSARATMNFVDRSNQPRSPESLIRRLLPLSRADIAVGGVIGAKHHYQDLNMVSAPRLDLCIHAIGKYPDLEFMEQLDPALTHSGASGARPQVALHFVRRKESLFERDEMGNAWADPVECLADLFEAGLDPQASEFLTFLTERRERLNAEY